MARYHDCPVAITVESGRKVAHFSNVCYWILQLARGNNRLHRKQSKTGGR